MRTLQIGTSLAALALAGAASAAVPDQGGPYNVSILEGGVGVERDLKAADAVLGAARPFTMAAWVRPDAERKGEIVLIGAGSANAESCRCLLVDEGRVAFRSGGRVLSSNATVPSGRRTHVAASSDGRTVSRYVAGRRVAAG